MSIYNSIIFTFDEINKINFIDNFIYSRIDKEKN
jgi:hypothetical protein